MLPLPPKVLARQRIKDGRAHHDRKLVEQKREQIWEALKRRGVDAKSRGSK